MPRISVGLDAQLASALLGGEGVDALPEIEQVLHETGASLLPQAPGQSPAELQADEVVWFSTDLEDEAGAAELASRLLDVEGVVSAYVVPPDSAP